MRRAAWMGSALVVVVFATVIAVAVKLCMPVDESERDARDSGVSTPSRSDASLSASRDPIASRPADGARVAVRAMPFSSGSPTSFEDIQLAPRVAHGLRVLVIDGATWLPAPNADVY